MTYLEIVWKKEKVHWKRMKTLMTKEFKGFTKIIGFIIACILTVVHYAYAFMHTAYETALYFFNRKAFRINLARLQITLDQTT